MKPYATPLCDAVLLRRYKRFLADARFADGTVATVHCPNPGAMTGLDAPGSPILLSDRANTAGARKLRYTWELVRHKRIWVCVNTQVANRVVHRWLESGRLLSNNETVTREPRHEKSRFDFRLGDGTLIEVKTVTLKPDPARAIGAFPDSVTTRGRRHMEELAAIDDRRRVLLFFVARGDVDRVRPADEIDPAYGAALRAAHAAGVEVHAVRARFTRRGVRMGPMLDVVL